MLDSEGFDWGEVANLRSPDRADEALLVEFFYEAREKKQETLKNGVPVFHDVLMVKITTPGGKGDLIREVKESDKTRFPRQWKAFEMLGHTPKTGMPIEELPGITASEVAQLKALALFTCEQIENLPDAYLKDIGLEARALRERCKTYLAKARDEKESRRIVEENVRLKNQLETMQRQLDELTALYGAEGREAPRKPRSRKVLSQELVS